MSFGKVCINCIKPLSDPFFPCGRGNLSIEFSCGVCCLEHFSYCAGIIIRDELPEPEFHVSYCREVFADGTYLLDRCRVKVVRAGCVVNYAIVAASCEDYAYDLSTMHRLLAVVEWYPLQFKGEYYLYEVSVHEVWAD